MGEQRNATRGVVVEGVMEGRTEERKRAKEWANAVEYLFGAEGVSETTAEAPKGFRPVGEAYQNCDSCQSSPNISRNSSTEIILPSLSSSSASSPPCAASSRL